MAKSTKQNFAGSVEHFNAIMGELIKRNFSNIYFLCGEEPYFIDRLCNYLSENILEQGEQSFNQFVLYGNEVTGMDISGVCRQYPMSAERNVVIIKEAHQTKGFDYLLKYFANPLKSTIVVICYSGTLNRATKLYKEIAKNGIYFESVMPRDYEMQNWLINHIRSKGYTIDSVSVSLLIESLGTSIMKIENELNKLINALKEGTRIITATDIEYNIGISKDFNNFELTRALSEFNIIKALQIADYFGNNPQKNSFQATIITIFNHFSKIFKLGLIQWEYTSQKKRLPNDMELASKLQIGSSYFLKEYRQALRYYPLKKLFIIFGAIRDYEMRGKGVDCGSANSGELLKELICKITAI